MKKTDFLHNRSGCLIALLVFLGALAALAYWVYHCEIHFDTIASPCGKYRVEIYYYLREALVPAMPGGGSDKAGCIYVIRNEDGQTLHRAELPMLHMGREIQFARDAAGHTKTISAPIWLWFELP